MPYNPNLLPEHDDRSPIATPADDVEDWRLALEGAFTAALGEEVAKNWLPPDKVEDAIRSLHLLEAA